MKNSGNHVNMDILNIDALNWVKKWDRKLKRGSLWDLFIFILFLALGIFLSVLFIRAIVMTSDSLGVGSVLLIIVIVLFVIFLMFVFFGISTNRRVSRIEDKLLEDFNNQFPKGTHERSRVMNYLLSQPEIITDSMVSVLTVLRKFQMPSSENQENRDNDCSDALSFIKKWDQIYRKRLFRAKCLFVFFLTIVSFSIAYFLYETSVILMFIVIGIDISIIHNKFKAKIKSRKDDIASQILRDFNICFSQDSRERLSTLQFLQRQPEKKTESMVFIFKQIKEIAESEPLLKPSKIKNPKKEKKKSSSTIKENPTSPKAKEHAKYIPLDVEDPFEEDK